MALSPSGFFFSFFPSFPFPSPSLSKQGHIVSSWLASNLTVILLFLLSKCQHYRCASEPRPPLSLTIISLLSSIQSEDVQVVSILSC